MYSRLGYILYSSWGYIFSVQIPDTFFFRFFLEGGYPQKAGYDLYKRGRPRTHLEQAGDLTHHSIAY